MSLPIYQKSLTPDLIKIILGGNKEF